MARVRNEDISIYFFVKDTLGSKVKKIVDSYPYTEIENDTLEVPSASVELRQTSDEGGELGCRWTRRSWTVDVFGANDTQRDDLADEIYIALNNSISIKDYSSGFNKTTGKSLLGADLRVIEKVNPQDILIRPTYSFDLHAKIKYWRCSISFSTISTGAV